MEHKNGEDNTPPQIISFGVATKTVSRTFHVSHIMLGIKHVCRRYPSTHLACFQLISGCCRHSRVDSANV